MICGRFARGQVVCLKMNKIEYYLEDFEEILIRDFL